MRDSRLPQTLLVAPDVPFTSIKKAFQELGWQQSNLSQTAPLIEGEPETATWTWQGEKPFVIYSYNPVAQLRVLDVATLPPVFRKALCDAVPTLSDKEVDHLFFSDDIKERLLGLWAAQETERIDLITQAERLQSDSDSIIAKQAKAVTKKLRSISEARLQTFASLQMLVQAAPELIRQLDNAEFVASLQPSLSDCKKLFDEHIAQAAFDAMQSLYHPGMRLNTIDPAADIKVTATPAGLLRWSNELSDKFPGAFRDLAGWMNPSSLWLTWTITDPEGSTVRYDGLSWLDNHWVWLPKVYRDLVPLCLSGRISQSKVH